MVKHIIIWDLKEEIENKDEIKKGIKEGLESLMGKIPGLTEIKVYTDGLESSNSDLMLYTVFTDESALKGYATNPLHVAVANDKVRPYTSLRKAFDFACDD